MDDHIVDAIMATDWTPALRERRLRLFDLKNNRGFTMPQTVAQLKAEGFQLELRTAWADWRLVRDLMIQIDAPRVKEVRDRCCGSLGYLKNLLMQQVARDLDPENGKPHVNPVVVRGIKDIEMAIGEFHGAIDRRGTQVNVHAGRTPLEEFEAKNGNGTGNGHGRFSSAAGGSVPK